MHLMSPVSFIAEHYLTASENETKRLVRII